MQRFVVEKYSMRIFAMRPQRSAVIGHYFNQGLVVEIVLTNLVEKLAYTGVGVRNFSVVRL